MIPSGLIVSCQKTTWNDSTTYDMVSMAINGGASGIRMIADEYDIFKAMGGKVTVPVILLTKKYQDDIVMITRSVIDGVHCANCGADYIATDGTGRWGYETIDALVAKGLKVIGDVATEEQAQQCEYHGCVAVTTALSGYIEKPFNGILAKPDIDLVRRIVKTCALPIIAEGRYHTTDQCQQAMRNGARAICIGAAITRPDILTIKFNGAILEKIS